MIPPWLEKIYILKERKHQEYMKYLLLLLLDNIIPLNSTMVGESFEIYLSQMAKNALKCPPWLEKILKFTLLKWL